MRMRRRRVDRLLTRASEACAEGREETAREAIAEIEQLSPFEPKLAELRAQVGAVPAAATVSPVSIPPIVEEMPSPQEPDEITSSHAERSLAVETTTLSVEEPTLPIVPSSIEADIRTEDPLIDLPLVVDEPEAAESVRVDIEERRGGRQFAVAAAALIACGALGWFLGPRMTTLVEPPKDVAAESTPVATGTLGTSAAPLPDEPKASEPLAPVQVAVDEVAANTTLETPRTEPQPLQPQTNEPSVTPPASIVRTTPPEPRSDTPVVASARREEPRAASERPPVASISTPDTPPPEVEKPAPLPALVTNTRPTIPAAPPLTNEPSAIVVPTAPAPAPPPTSAATSPLPRASEAPAAPRDEEKIRSVLDQYASAYSRLDATAASAIFPGVDRRALARAFDGLAAQSIHLGACDVRVAIESAMVDCAGSATWTPKIGGGSRTEPRRWQFRLRNESGAWQMVGAKVR